MALIECVPNVSEGRRPARRRRARRGRSMAVAGVRLLDRLVRPRAQSIGLHLCRRGRTDRSRRSRAVRLCDPGHRFAGAPRRAPAAWAPSTSCPSSRSAARRWRTASRSRRQTAAAVAARFQIPVFLYEEAASSRARRNLADVRRGEFEGLAEKMARPEWAPDYGPPQPHPTAGATAIGARAPLIAFNVNLATDRLDVARAIAAACATAAAGCHS